jgi:hypothetical protein
MAIIAVPALIVWLISFGLAGDPGFIFGLIENLWFFGHGVPLIVAIDAPTAASLGLAAEPLRAMFSLFPLGFMLFTAGFAARTGWRLAAHQLSVAGWGAGSAIVTMFVMSWVLSSVAPRPPLSYGVVGTAVMPTLVFTVGLSAGFLANSIREDAAWFSRLRHLVRTRAAETWQWTIESALLGARIGGYALTSMVASAALVFSLRLAFSYVDVVSLSQQLHVDGTGLLVLFLVNVAYLPVMLMWTLSWIIGPGFSIGIGSSVSTISTQLGPVPSLPILGMLPTGSNPWALAIVNLILLSGVLAAIGVLRQHRREGGSKPHLRELSVSVGVAAALVGFVTVAGMWLATGAMGPGRLMQTGPHPWLVGGIATVEVLVAVSLGVWLTYTDWDRVVAVALDKTQGIRESKPVGAVGAFTQKLNRRGSSRESARSSAAATEAEHPSSPSWATDETQPIEPIGSERHGQTHPDETDTVAFDDFTPWWGEKDDTI